MSTLRSVHAHPEVEKLHKTLHQAKKAYQDLETHAKKHEARVKELEDQIERRKSSYEEPLRRSAKSYDDDEPMRRSAKSYDDDEPMRRSAKSYEDEPTRWNAKSYDESARKNAKSYGDEPRSARSLSPSRDTIKTKGYSESKDQGSYEEVCSKLSKALEAKKAAEKLSSSLQSHVKDLSQKHEKYQELKAKHERLSNEHNSLKLEHARAKREAKENGEFKVEAKDTKRDCEKLAAIAASSVEQSKKYEDALHQVHQILSVYHDVLKESDPKLAEHIQDTREGIAKQLKS